MSWKKYKSYLGLFLVATASAIFLRLFVIDSYRISSGSMYTSLWLGDLVFVKKYVYNVHLPFSDYELVRFRNPRRGDIVTFSVPKGNAGTFIKRVVALEGDRVAFEKGILKINGEAAQYTPVEGTSSPIEWEKLPGSTQKYRIQSASQRQENYGPVDVPKGYFFVLGDNRVDSIDSRSWGPIPLSCVSGQLGRIWLSVGNGGIRWDRVGL